MQSFLFSLFELRTLNSQSLVPDNVHTLVARLHVQAEEERLVGGQRQENAGSYGSAGKKRKGKGGGKGQDALPLPTQNGEGDQLSVSSGVLQVRLPEVSKTIFHCEL